MTENKIKVRWIALGTAGVLVILLLCRCAPQQEDVTLQAEPEQTTVATQETQAPPATTVPVTEAPLETEAATEPTVENYFFPKGIVEEEAASGSDDDYGDDDDEEDSSVKTKDTLVIPDPGTAANPYVEVPGQLPAEVDTVQVPAGKSVCYRIAGSAGSVITIEASSISATVDGKTVQAENGVLKLDLSETEADPVISLDNAGTEAAAYVVKLEAGISKEIDVQVLTDLAAVEVSLAEGDSSGRYYRWEADTDGQVTLTDNSGKLALTVTIGETKYTDTEGSVEFPVKPGQEVDIHCIAKSEEGAYPAVSGAKITGSVVYGTLKESNTLALSLKAADADGITCRYRTVQKGTVTAEAEGCDVALSDGTSTVRLSELAQGESLSLELAKDAVLTVQVSAKPDENGDYPAAEARVTMSFVEAAGTSAANALAIADPLTAATVEVEAGETLYLSGMGHEMVASVEDAAGASLVFAQETVEPDGDNGLSLEFPQAEGEAQPLVFALHSSQDREYTLTFAYPVGHRENPAALVLGENTVTAEAAAEGYCLRWTAQYDGELIVGMAEDGAWQYSIEDASYSSATDEAEQRIAVSAGQVLVLEVKAPDDETPDPEAAENAAAENPEPEQTPAGEIRFTAAFYDPLLGTEEKPVELDTAQINSLQIEAGEVLYCTAKAQGLRVTVSGSDVTMDLDEAGEAWLMVLTNGAQEARTLTVEFTAHQDAAPEATPETTPEATPETTAGGGEESPEGTQPEAPQDAR